MNAVNSLDALMRLCLKACSIHYRRIKNAIIAISPEKTNKITYLGNDFYYPSKSLIGKQIAKGVEWDGQLLRSVLPNILMQNCVAIEVGANIGASTLVIKNIVKDLQILLVEPSDRFYSYLAKNVARSGNIIGIDRRIISDKTKQNVVLNTNATTGTPSNANYGGDLVSSQLVETVTIDELSRQYGLTRVDFLKVDTDGYELEVFSGAVETITSHKPLIFTEFSPPSLQRMHPEKCLIDLLKYYGCKFFLVFKSDGRYAGCAESYEEIILLKGVDYYVDLFCTPAGGAYDKPLYMLVSSVNR